ncbi:MAG: hypothetical protein ACREMF_01575 [Gemmatimonadales bacterium]
MGKIVGGIGLIVVSLFMLLGFLSSSQPISLPAAAVMLLLTVGLPAASGVGLLYLRFREGRAFQQRRDQLRVQTYQSEILKLAGRKGGKLTLVELLTDSALSTEDAEAALGGLVERGIADIEVTDSGVLVYAFHDVQKLPEKDSSRGILEA